METTEKRAALIALGCDAAQGYHFCKPMPVDGIVRDLLQMAVRSVGGRPDRLASWRQWSIISGVHTLASSVNWGSVPDWIAGIGSVLAFAGFTIAFIWEVGKRRRDDEQAQDERRDALKRHARLVVTKIAGGSETQTRLIIHNTGSGPIIDVVTTVWVWSDGATGKLREIPLARRGPDVTELTAGESGEVWLWFAGGERISVDQEFFPQIEFTDCDGIRWRRQDNQQPVRMLGQDNAAV